MPNVSDIIVTLILVGVSLPILFGVWLLIFDLISDLIGIIRRHFTKKEDGSNDVYY